MFRKLIPIIIATVFFFHPVDTVVQSQNSPMVDNNFPQDIYRALDNPNEDLYLRIYDNLKYKAPKLAAKRAASFFELSADDIVALTEGEFPDSVQEYCGDTFDSVVDCRTEILDAYILELELFYLEQELEEEAYASEVWSNGTLEDGSFDLLVDLNLIDLIIFGKRAKIATERFPESEKTNLQDVDLSEIGEDREEGTGSREEGAGTRVRDPEGGRGSGPGAGGRGPGVGTTSPDGGRGGTSTEIAATYPFSDQTLYQTPLSIYFGPDRLIPFEDDDAVSVNQCIDPAVIDLKLLRDPDLLPGDGGEYIGPVHQFTEEVPRGGLGYPPLPKSPYESDRDDREEGGGSRDSDNGGGEDRCDGEMFFGLFCVPTSELCPAKMQSGSKEDPIYIDFGICFDINFVNDSGDAGGDDDSGITRGATKEWEWPKGGDQKGGAGGGSSKKYSKTDNCTNCHIVFINKILRELLGIPLTPHRNTMTANFEIGSAWNFLTNIGPLIEIYKKPVPMGKNKDKDKWRKPGSEKESGLSAKEEHQEMTEKIDEVDNQVKLDKHNHYIPDEKTFRRRMQRYTTSETLDQVNKKIQAELRKKEVLRKQLLKEIPIANRIQDNSNYWESVSREFGYFYSNMQSIQRYYHYLGDVVSKKIIEETAIECRVKQDQ